MVCGYSLLLPCLAASQANCCFSPLILTIVGISPRPYLKRG